MDTSSLDLALAPTLIPPLYLGRSTLFSLDDTYIFDVTASASHFIVSASNHQIKLYTPEALAISRTLDYHTDNITQIKVYKDNFLLSSSKDSTIALWDLRQDGKPAQIFQGGQHDPLLCFDVNSAETVLAAGTELSAGDEAKILFWDVRATTQVAQFVESHSDDVTQMHFHPGSPNTLLSASVDGLVCTYDITQFDEDEALLAVVNSGASVSKVGFFGPSAEYMYYLTHMETFALHTALEGDLIYNFGDVRRASHPGILQLDYVVDCRYDFDSQRLYMIAGSNDGDINLLHVNTNQLQLCQVLRGAHTEVIRSVHWDVRANILLSGAEDTRLCLWTETQVDCPPIAQVAHRQRAAPKANVANSKNESSGHQGKRHNPY